MEHLWKEHRFDPDGELNGFRCAVQEHICKNCKIIVELPMGVSPRDYPIDSCKGGTNGTLNHNLHGGELPKDLRMQSDNVTTVNRHHMRRMRILGELRSEEKL